MEELQKIKELNNKEFNYKGYTYIFILEENNRGAFQLKIILKDKVYSLMPHLEQDNIICYDKSSWRYVSSLEEIDIIQITIKKIIDTWVESDSSKNEDVIISELDRYITPKNIEYWEKSFINACVNVSDILLITNTNNIKKVNVEIKNRKILIEKTSAKKKQITNVSLFEIDAKEIIELGYQTTYDLKNYLVSKYCNKNLKSKYQIFVINSKNSRSTFIINDEKNKFGFAKDDSFATKNNSRLEEKTILDNKNILVIGAGAIGSHTIPMLASLWPKSITIFDGDLIDRGSSVRQNYDAFWTGSYKTSVMKIMLEKYNGVIVNEFPNMLSKEFINNNEINLEIYDYIFDFTGEGIIQSNFSLFKEKCSQAIIVSSFIQNTTAYVKISKIKNIDSMKNNDFIKYDSEINKRQSNDNEKIIKGCDPIIPYSYISVYNAATLTVKALKKYTENDMDGFYAEQN